MDLTRCTSRELLLIRKLARFDFSMVVQGNECEDTIGVTHGRDIINNIFESKILMEENIVDV